MILSIFRPPSRSFGSVPFDTVSDLSRLLFFRPSFRFTIFLVFRFEFCRGGPLLVSFRGTCLGIRTLGHSVFRGDMHQPVGDFLWTFLLPQIRVSRFRKNFSLPYGRVTLRMSF